MNTDNRKVSIIVPVYNTEMFLSKCINSVLEQSYSDFELILVDDGSTDNSSHICDEYAKKDNRIKVIHKKNGGVSAARNNGVRVATGYWVTFIDADDCIDCDMLNSLKNYLITENDLIVFGFKYINTDGKILDSSNCVDDICNVKDFVKKYYQKFYINHILDSACAKLYKKNILLENNIVFNEDFCICEDGLFVSDYLFFTNQVQCVNKNLYYYVQHNSFSLMKKYNINALEARKVFLKSQQNLLAKLNLVNREISKSIYTSSANFYVNHINKLLILDDFNRENKILLLKSYLNDNVFRICLKYYKTKNLKQKIIKLFIKLKLKNILLICGFFSKCHSKNYKETT